MKKKLIRKLMKTFVYVYIDLIANIFKVLYVYNKFYATLHKNQSRKH